MISFFVFLFCLLATYPTYLVMTRKSAAQRDLMERRMTEVLTPCADFRRKSQAGAKETHVRGLFVA